MTGYNVLGAGFEIERDQYSGWNNWPVTADAERIFTDELQQVTRCMRNLLTQTDHPHMCRGVGVLTRFLEMCEALKGSKSQMKRFRSRHMLLRSQLI